MGWGPGKGWRHRAEQHGTRIAKCVGDQWWANINARSLLKGLGGGLSFALKTGLSAIVRGLSCCLGLTAISEPMHLFQLCYVERDYWPQPAADWQGIVPAFLTCVIQHGFSASPASLSSFYLYAVHATGIKVPPVTIPFSVLDCNQYWGMQCRCCVSVWDTHFQSQGQWK